jgi:hypothetical protein
MTFTAPAAPTASFGRRPPIVAAVAVKPPLAAGA